MVNATPRPLNPQERDLVPFIQEVGWAPGPVWTGAKNLFSKLMLTFNRDAPSKFDSLRQKDHYEVSPEKLILSGRQTEVVAQSLQ